MTASGPAGLTLDTGALLALDQASKAVLMQERLAAARRQGAGICIPAGTIAQAWRDPRQVRLSRLLKSSGVEIAVMTSDVARVVGALAGEAGHADVIDVHVVFCARQRRHAVVTSDPTDIARVDPGLPLIRV